MELDDDELDVIKQLDLKLLQTILRNHYLEEKLMELDLLEAEQAKHFAEQVQS